MDYYNDRFGAECLKLANRCKSNVGFGAILVKNNKILGRGWNRRSTPEERSKMSHVDYAIHAEQAAILDALSRHPRINDSTIYVLGMSLKSGTKGKLAINKGPVFICTKCPHALSKYKLNVAIPDAQGWIKLDAQRAMETGKRFAGTGYWKHFCEK